MLASVHQLYFAIPIYRSRNSSELCLVLPSLYLMMLNYFLEIFKINYNIAYEIQKLVCVCLYVHEYEGLGLVWHHSYVVPDFLLRRSSFQDLNILDKICITLCAPADGGSQRDICRREERGGSNGTRKMHSVGFFWKASCQEVVS